MEDRSLLDNDEIIFVYERLIRDLITLELFVEGETKKLQEAEGRIGNIQDPLARRFSDFIAGESLKQKREMIEKITNESGDLGKHLKILKKVVNTLDLPYYAITGRTRDEIKERVKGNIDVSQAIKIFGDILK